MGEREEDSCLGCCGSQVVMGGGLPGLRLFFLLLSGMAYTPSLGMTASKGTFNTVIADPCNRTTH